MRYLGNLLLDQTELLVVALGGALPAKIPSPFPPRMFRLVLSSRTRAPCTSVEDSVGMLRDVLGDLGTTDMGASDDGHIRAVPLAGVAKVLAIEVAVATN